MSIDDIIKEAELKNNEENYEEAFVLYSKAIEVMPNDSDLYSIRGIILFNLGRKEEALIDLDKAVELEPNYSYRYSSRAYVKASLLMTNEAIADYKKCTELDPKDEIAFNNMGLLEDQLRWNKKTKNAERIQNKKADSLDTILKERGISAEKKKNSTTKPEPEPEPISKGKVVKDVFTKKESFKEFVNFVKSGFKLKND